MTRTAKATFIVLIIMMLGGSLLALAQSPEGNGTVSGSEETPAMTAAEKEAQARLHYRVAVKALDASNLQVALAELRKAAKLAPDNALVQFNLAVIYSKTNKARLGLAALKRAQTIGLPSAQANEASELEVTLSLALATASAAPKALWLYFEDGPSGTIRDPDGYDSLPSRIGRLLKPLRSFESANSAGLLCGGPCGASGKYSVEFTVEQKNLMVASLAETDADVLILIHVRTVQQVDYCLWFAGVEFFTADGRFERSGGYLSDHSIHECRTFSGASNASNDALESRMKGHIIETWQKLFPPN